MKKEKKILIVLPSDDTIYGSGRCAVYLANSFDYKYDILIGKSLIHKNNLDYIKKIFNDNLESVYEMWLPNFNAYYGRVENIPIHFAEIHKYFMWLISKVRYKKLIRNNAYDIIHLNSSILVPMIDNKDNYVVHIREIFDGNNVSRNYFCHKLEKAKGIIYINPSTREALNFKGKTTTLIPDPFDMKNVEHIDREDARVRFGVHSEAVVISILGRYEDRNGQEFIINGIKKCKRKDIVLLIVGAINKDDEKKCRDILGNDERFKIIGELTDPTPIFAISDYIIRGEAFFAGFGRTLYEGLYSGCHVIYPGIEERDSSKVQQYDDFKEMIHFYIPRDTDSLCQLIDNLCTKIPYPREYTSNISIGKQMYEKLVEDILKE